MPRGERQLHGFKFEEWIKGKFLDIRYTGEWDIPQKLNPNPAGGPISIKTVKWEGAIHFGDALKRFQINHPFTLIVGFWKQKAGKKKIVKLTEVIINPEKWGELWEPLTVETLRDLDKRIKDRTLSSDEVQELIKERMSKLRREKPTIITLNPKIDSKAQRRLQCSLSFKKFFKHVVGIEPDSVEEDKVFSLWGKELVPPDF